jgi:carboxyl-terminal processing protease
MRHPCRTRRFMITVGRRRIRGGPLWSIYAVSGLLIATACSTDRDVNGTAQPRAPMSAHARAYLDELLDVMEHNSLNRLIIDWIAFRATVLTQAAGAQSIPDTYPGVEAALFLLRDDHSSYRAATGMRLFGTSRSCTAPHAAEPTLPSTIGYVKVAGFAGSGADAMAFANAIQQEIEASDSEDTIGWMVDVRGNGGGNMWPMIAGIGPVLGEGVGGYFIDPEGTEGVWEYRAGASWLDGIAQQRVDTPYRLRREQPRVAVLTDGQVISSGEAVVVAFRGRPSTRSFGTPTCGLSTANHGFRMSDGATLNLTVATMADRTKTLYGDSIAPDEIVSSPDQAVQRAVDWLTSPIR